MKPLQGKDPLLHKEVRKKVLGKVIPLHAHISPSRTFFHVIRL